MGLYEDISTIVTAAGYTLDRVYELPDSPDDINALIRYPGKPDSRVGNGYEHPKFQLVCRGTDLQALDTRIEAIRAALDAVLNQDINGTRYLKIDGQAPSDVMGKDDQGRFRLLINFEVWNAK